VPGCEPPGPDGVISGSVWHDLDRDGVRDDGERAVSGVAVALTGVGAPRHASTGADGTYVFAMSEPGDYHLTITAPAGASFVPAGTGEWSDVGLEGRVDVGLDQHETRVVDAGVVLTSGGLTGIAWSDDDRDGVHEAADGIVAGVVVTLLGGGDLPVAQTTTDASGSYSFHGLVGDEELEWWYTATPPPGYTFSPTGSFDAAIGRAPAIVTPEGEARYDIALVRDAPGTGVLAGRAWDDLDRDGIQDTGEAGVGGVGVDLVRLGGEPVASTATGADGRYRFVAEAGTYFLRFHAPGGRTFAPLGAGADDRLDSDVRPAAGTTDHVEVRADDSRTDIDAGLARPMVSVQPRETARPRMPGR
jgi:serine-aspartate repeat-containing protein C/D/E